MLKSKAEVQFRTTLAAVSSIWSEKCVDTVFAQFEEALVEYSAKAENRNAHASIFRV